MLGIAVGERSGQGTVKRFCCRMRKLVDALDVHCQWYGAGVRKRCGCL